MLTPERIAEKAVEVGKKKASLTTGKMLVLAMFAGAFIALAGAGSILANVYVGKLAGACVFPIGLIMVVLAGSELFTGNNLMVMAAVRREISWFLLLKNWVVVIIGNLLGAGLVAGLAVYSGALDGVADTVVKTAVAKSELGILEATLRGVLCNFLVCIAVWMAFGAKSAGGKAVAIFGPVMLFVLCGFEHSVANMFYGPAGVLMGIRGEIVANLSMETFVVNNLIPVTVGNIIGGAGLVGLGYYLAWPKNPSRGG